MEIFAQSENGSKVESKTKKSGLYLLASGRHVRKRKWLRIAVSVDFFQNIYINKSCRKLLFVYTRFFNRIDI